MCTRLVYMHVDFPDGSDVKASAYNVEDLGSIPGSERSSGEGNGNPLQYSWASLVAQLVKSLPVMRETWVRSLGVGKNPWRRERLRTLWIVSCVILTYVCFTFVKHIGVTFQHYKMLQDHLP